MQLDESFCGHMKLNHLIEPSLVNAGGFRDLKRRLNSSHIASLLSFSPYSYSYFVPMPCPCLDLASDSWVVRGMVAAPYSLSTLALGTHTEFTDHSGHVPYYGAPTILLVRVRVGVLVQIRCRARAVCSPWLSNCETSFDHYQGLYMSYDTR